MSGFTDETRQQEHAGLIDVPAVFQPFVYILPGYCSSWTLFIMPGLARWSANGIVCLNSSAAEILLITALISFDQHLSDGSLQLIMVLFPCKYCNKKKSTFWLEPGSCYGWWDWDGSIVALRYRGVGLNSFFLRCCSDLFGQLLDYSLHLQEKTEKGRGEEEIKP